jgi:hypothetical protein
LDQFIKQNLKYKYYLRYVDDFVLLDRDKEKLKSLIGLINEFLETKLDLELSFSKTKLQPINKGISFLGYFLKPNYILVRQKVVKRLKNKLYNANHANFSRNSLKSAELASLKKILAMINSYYGHFSHAFSFNLRKDIYENHLGKLQKEFLPKLHYSSLKYAKN